MAFERQRGEKVIPTDKKVAKWVLDPFYEIADIDTNNNAFPREPEQPTRFQVFKGQRQSMPNPMQQQKQAAGAVQGAKNSNELLTYGSQLSVKENTSES
jgi:hypothetical protein